MVTSLPAACTASIRHERTARPSMMTVHAPQTPCSQPTWVPVRSRSSRRKSASVLRASTDPVRAAPFTVTVMSAIGHCLSLRIVLTGTVRGRAQSAPDQGGRDLLPVLR